MNPELKYTSLTVRFSSKVIEIHFAGTGRDSSMGEYTTSGLLAEVFKVPGGLVAMSFGRPIRVFTDEAGMMEWVKSYGAPVKMVKVMNG